MNQSDSVLTAQIQFIEDRLSLIHIPIEFYNFYTQAIIQILDSPGSSDLGDDNEERSPSAHSPTAWTKKHPFLNISITPLECSIVCSRTLTEEYLLPAMERLSGPSRGMISSEEYVAISVVGEGLDAGQRVLDLSTPLAMAGISIFFFTTYFSDYILVPLKARSQVIKTLEARGFTFSEASHKYVNPAASHSRNISGGQPASPSTPLPSSEIEMQQRTMELLKCKNIVPVIQSSLQLLQLAGRNDKTSRSDLEIGVIKCLVNPPEFFSITLTQSESPSLLMCKKATVHFGLDSDNLLLGSKNNYLASFLFDLKDLPTEATGIVCGVSSKLVGGNSIDRLFEGVDMRYLSTYRGAAVIVDQEELDKAIALLHDGEAGLEAKQV